jgi:hypothetical protein
VGIGGALFGMFVALLQNGRVELDAYADVNHHGRA